MDFRLEIFVVLISLKLNLHAESDARDGPYPKAPLRPWSGGPSWRYAKGGKWVPIYSQRRSHIGPPPHVNEVMTEWSPWGPWEKCSRSCGGGVTSRKRKCVSRYPRVMPGSGIRTSHDHCSGQGLQYQVCGTEPCGTAGQLSAISFRLAQCRRHNNRRVLGRVINSWIPYNQGGINPCALVCEGEGEGIVYTFGKVTDGTDCKTEEGNKGLCINGRCMRLSCDGRLGGTAVEDMCRVCGGSNDTCTRHVGVYHFELPSADQPVHTNDVGSPIGQLQKRRQTFGYYEVATIPSHSTNVKIIDNSGNFLALKSSDKYLLNGDWLIDWPGDVDAAGTSFTYVRQENNTEALSTVGPTKEELTLMVLLRDHNPGIYYEYWMPKTSSDRRSKIITDGIKSNSPLNVPKAISETTTVPPTPSTSPPMTSAKTTPISGLKPAVISSLNFNSSNHRQDSVSRLESISRQGSVNRTKYEPTPESDLPRLPSQLKNSKKTYEEDSNDEKDEPSDSKVENEINNENKSDKNVLSVTPNNSSLKEINLLNVSVEDRSKNSITANFSSENNVNKLLKVNKRKKWKKSRKDKRKKKRKKKEKGKRPAYCSPCPKLKKAKESFCTSKFVSLVEVQNQDIEGDYRRLEVSVLQSYKNVVPLLAKEFLWQHKCSCRRLRQGKSYVVMGSTAPGRGREVRLVIPEEAFVRKFSPKVLSRLIKFRNDELRVCSPWREDLKMRYSKLKKYLLRHSRKYKHKYNHDNTKDNLVT